MSNEALFSCLARRGSAATCRLICFPWSGGGTAAYARWGRLVPEFLEVLAVRLRGRENRFGEDYYAERAELVEEVAEGIVSRGFFDGCRVAFFGHSLGSIIAVETALYLKRRHKLEPDHLFVSGASAPNSPKFREYLNTRNYSGMSDSDLKAWLIGQGGTPKEILDNDEFLRIHLRALRGDLGVVESYSFDHDLTQLRLACPIVCLDGEADNPHDQDSFRELTTSREFENFSFPGGHFYLLQEENRDRLLRIVTDRLEGFDEIV